MAIQAFEKIQSNPEEIEWKSDFLSPICMLSHINNIWKGEYDHFADMEFASIADIGANVGGYAIWAAFRYRPKFLHCFEPVPRNFDILDRNLRLIPKGVHALRSNVALSSKCDQDRIPMYLGKHNWGECSMFQGDEQSDRVVDVLVEHPNWLPSCELVKIDTEGCEQDILLNYNLSNTKAITGEIHSQADLDGLISYFKDADFQLTTNKPIMQNRWIVSWRRN